MKHVTINYLVKKSLLQDICHHHDHDGPKYNFQPTNHLLPTIIFHFVVMTLTTTSTGQEFNVYLNTQQTANKWRALRARSQSSPPWPSWPLPLPPPLSQPSQIIWEYIRSNAIGEKLSYPFLLQVHLIFYSTLQTLLFFLINVLNSVQI